jgi:hypothetical protein
MIFTNTATARSQTRTALDQIFRENRAVTDIPKAREATAAPNPLHPPVNRLHSIEKSEDTVLHFLLTPEMKRVKRYSFFDSF